MMMITWAHLLLCSVAVSITLAANFKECSGFTCQGSTTLLTKPTVVDEKDAGQYFNIVQFDSLKDISNKTKGFQIQYRTDVVFADTPGRIVGLIGEYDIGKSYAASHLTGKEFPQGFGVVTSALAVILPTEKLNAVVLDSSGAQRAVRYEDIFDRHVTDVFIQDMIIDLSDVILFVVGTLRVRDQVRIQEILRRIKGTNKILYIVHNYIHLTTKEQVDTYIERDILTAFSGFADRGYWISTDVETSQTVRHVVLANASSGVGRDVNPKAFEMLRSWLHAADTAQPFRKNLNITSEVKKHLERILPQYVYPAHPENRAQWLGFGVVAKTFVDQLSATLGLTSWIDWFTGSANSTVTPRAADAFEIVVDSDSKSSSTQVSNTSSQVFQARLVLKHRDLTLEYLPANHVGELPGIAVDSPHDEIFSTSKQRWCVFIDAPGVKAENVTLRVPNNRAFTVIGRRDAPNEYHELVSGDAPTNLDSTSESLQRGYSYTQLKRLNDQRYAYKFLAHSVRHSGFSKEFLIPPEIDPSTMTKTVENGVIQICGKFRVVLEQ